MSEFVRFIEQQDFEDGIDLRLLLGSIAVGDVCKIRFEDIDTRHKKRPLRFAEAVISIVSKRDENGLWRLDYVYEALTIEGSHTIETDYFNENSIAITREGGLSLRTYLSDQPDSRWDGAMVELADFESSGHAIVP